VGGTPAEVQLAGPGGGGGGAVSSVFTRTGAVVAQSGDYNATQIPNVVVNVTQSATPAIDTDNGNVFSITGLAQSITSLTTNLTGTPVHGQQIIIEITDNGTPRAITWGSSFASVGVALPTTTVPNKCLRTQFTWDTVTSTWDVEWSSVLVSGGGSSLITQVNSNTSGTFTAAIGDAINLTGAATITLPASPSIGDAVLITSANVYGFATTITANTGQTINGGSSGGSVTIPSQYNGTQAVQVLVLATSSTTWEAISSGTDLGGGLEVQGLFAVTGPNATISASLRLFAGLSFDNAVTETSAYTTTTFETWVRATSGTWTLTLGNATMNQILLITNEGTGTITVTPQSGTIDGVASRVLTGSSHPCSIIVICDTTNWHTLASFGAVT
jgi:hypothetical protein